MAMNAKPRPMRRQLFPEKLWDLVNKPDSGVKWTPDGKKIEVERAQLEKLIGTKFRSKNFDSFIRQLHFYGFRKSGNYYQHDKFQRGQPEALHTMKRKYSNQNTLNPSTGSSHTIGHEFSENTFVDTNQQQCYPIDYSITTRKKIRPISPYKSPTKSISKRQAALLFYIE